MNDSIKRLSSVIEQTAPRYEPFYFGLYNCAVCFGEVRGRDRVTKTLRKPYFADYAATEIMIPGGRQAFHRACLTTDLIKECCS